MAYAMNEQHAKHDIQPRQTRPRLAFTLVELMVVIGILAILLAIAVPTSTALLDSNRAKQTLATMKVLELAIQEYADAAPITGGPKLAASPDCWYVHLFGTYPPSPTSAFAHNYSNLADVVGGGSRVPTTDEEASETFSKMLRLVNAYLGDETVAPEWKHGSRIPMTQEKQASIETLYLFISVFSPGGKQALSQLPGQCVTNEDQDLVFEDANSDSSFSTSEKAFDLFEVRDAWKQPLRYAVRSPGGDTFPARWELRSAGPDGLFSTPFTPKDKSDDVVLRGPQDD